MSYCYINGQCLPIEQAHVSVTDRGLLLADGVFTTLRCYNGQPFALATHWQRLQNAANLLRLRVPISYAQLIRDCEKLITLNQFSQHDSSLRITLTRGPGPRGVGLPPSPEPTLIIQNHALIRPPVQTFSLTCNYDLRLQLNSLSTIKTLAYTSHIMARQCALDQGFSDTILLNTSNEVCSSSHANIFIVSQQQLYTPQLACGIVAGIMRQLVLQLAQEAHIPCHTTSLRLNNLHEADEVFLTNSLIEIQSVNSFERTPFKVEAAAPITQRLKRALQQHITQALKSETQ